MDVLKAELKWIDDRCYRLLCIEDKLGSPDEDDDNDNLHSSVCIQEDDDYDPDLPILHQGNTFYITIHVPNELVGLVRGKYSKNIQEIERNGSKVNIPRDRSGTIEITISGSTKKIVSDAYRKIEDKIITARLRFCQPTHFISFPVNSAEIKKSFLKFKDEVLAKYKKIRGVDESIFQNPSKLHVTVSLLVLLDEMDNQNAIIILKNATDNILKQIGGKKFAVQVKGIEYMNDDPAEVDVLYAKLNELGEDNCLQILADSIMKEFVKANLSKSQEDKVKLHITVMNSLFRDKLDDQDERFERKTFDARQILKDFKDYDFGQIIISEIHISVRYSTAISTGYYVAVHKIKLNP